MPALTTLIRSVLLIALPLALGASLVGCGGGGTPATLVGTVQDDSTLVGITGATAQVTPQAFAFTTTAGAFLIQDAPTGTQTLSVFKNGYTTATVTVSLAEGGNNAGTIYLTPAHISGLGTITGLVLNAGTPVGGATVVGGGQAAVSKSNGTFALYNVTPGTVTVTAQSGPKTGRTGVTLAPDGIATATISLSTSPPGPPVI